MKHIPDNDYLLLTPGPLSTSKRVRAAMLKDFCTWDSDYMQVVQEIRESLLEIASLSTNYTSILMQGSGSYAIESVINTALGKNKNAKLLVVENGEYGRRISQIAKRADIAHTSVSVSENAIITPSLVECALEDREITHVAFVHCETTTGILNPLTSLCKVIKERGKILIVDAMSSFGGIPIDIENLGIDFLISSSNKCIQGVPGFAFILARINALQNLEGNATSLALDMYAQWECMERLGGKWRFTSPTHAVMAFREALRELKDEGGIEVRHRRYSTMQRHLASGMEELGYPCYVDRAYHSPIITTFCYPNSKNFSFENLYAFLKQRGFVIYPGKLSKADTFRLGNIGDLCLDDIKTLLGFVGEFNLVAG